MTMAPRFAANTSLSLISDTLTFSLSSLVFPECTFWSFSGHGMYSVCPLLKYTLSPGGHQQTTI